MRRLIGVLAALSLAFAPSALAQTAAKGDATKGKLVFEGTKPACKTCHTETKNPLAKAVTNLTPEQIEAWVRTPKEMIAKENKKGMMPAYTPQKISDNDLNDLVAYLKSLK